MANPKNTKLDKDALKQPDEFLVLNTKLMTWVIQHKFVVIAIVVVILLIGAGFSGMKYRGYTQELKASERTAQAMQQYVTEVQNGNEDAFTGVDAMFAEIFNNYGKTKNVGYAYTAHGNIAYQAKAYDKALASYQEALPYYNSDPVVASNIQNSIAHTYWAKGDLDRALENFQKVAANPNAAQQDDALFSIGAINAERNDKAAADKAFAELVTKYPNSMFAELLKNR